MEKLFEKKNLGIPTALLVLISYFIGYYFSSDLSGLLIALIFGFTVFALNFDDKVKIAIKQSYVVGLAFALIYMFTGILNQFNNTISAITNYQNPLHIQTIFNDLFAVVNNLLNVADIIIFAILIIMAFAGKEVKLGFISGILGEGVKKQNPPVHQQQVPPAPVQYQQPIQQPAPMQYQQPIQPAPIQNQQPVSPVNQQPAGGCTCQSCGTVNKEGALFCSTCGQKLQ